MLSGRWLRPQIRAVTSLHVMWLALAALLPRAVAIVAMILLPAIAFASPPDPSWIAGIYDGADGDDIVSLVDDTVAAHAADGSHITARLCFKELALESIARGVSSRRFARQPRAPPVPGSAILARVLRCAPRCSSTASGTDPPVIREWLSESSLPACLNLDVLTSSLWSNIHFANARDHVVMMIIGFTWGGCVTEGAAAGEVRPGRAGRVDICYCLWRREA
jgi:hypothetical protein